MCMCLCWDDFADAGEPPSGRRRRGDLRRLGPPRGASATQECVVFGSERAVRKRRSGCQTGILKASQVKRNVAGICSCT